MTAAALRVLRTAWQQARSNSCLVIKGVLETAAEAFLAGLLAECPECFWLTPLVAGAVLAVEKEAGC